MRLVWGDDLDDALRPVLGATLVSSMAGSATWSFMAIWAIEELDAKEELPFALLVSAPEEGKAFLRGVMKGRPGDYFRMWKQYSNRRGMNHWYDIIDWVGGYPYEVATADQLFEFYKNRGFMLTKMKCGYVGLGCNEFVFVRGNR